MKKLEPVLNDPDLVFCPRCKGKCGDAECEEAEKQCRAANGVAPLPEQLWLFNIEPIVEPIKSLIEKWSVIEEDCSAIIIESEETPYIPIVMIESPYAGDVERNVAYLRAALHDCLMRGEAPFASHGLYTQVLDDTNPEERSHGIQAGFAFRQVSDYTVVYDDLGVSPGMQLGIDHSHSKNIPVKFRSLPGWGKEEASTK